MNTTTSQISELPWIRRMLLALLVAAALLVAWYVRAPSEDAFITFRYAQHLAEGQGLTYNPGERVEGYTNFLWAVWLATGFRLGAEPVLFSYVSGFGLLIISLLLFYKLAHVLTGSYNVALGALAIYAFNSSNLVNAISGMEPPLQTCLLLGAVLLLALSLEKNVWEPGRMALLSVVLAAAFLTRMDSGIVIVIVFIVAFAHFVRNTPRPKMLRLTIALLAPFLLITGIWLAWKLSYYGDIFPNTYYAKQPAPELALSGIRYLFDFCTAYMLWPFVAIGLVAMPAVIASQRRTMLVVLLLVVVLWSAYIISTGGVGADFRFMVPIWPFICLIIVWVAIYSCAIPRRAGISLLALVIMFSGVFIVRSVERVQTDIGQMHPFTANMMHIGKTLAEFLGGTDVCIGVTAAGAIPYYSDLPTIDLLGLNDAWIARHGPVVGVVPGHQRRAPLEYLQRRKVNLLFRVGKKPRDWAGSEWSDVQAVLSSFTMLDPPCQSVGSLPDRATVLCIPLGDDCILPALYLHPHPAVDRLIATGKCTAIAIPAKGKT